jgi:hypothetical protein
MFQPLSKAIQAKQGKEAWDESDVRHFVQSWLRKETGVEAIYCENFRGRVALVRAASPAVRQMAKLLEHDLREALTTTLHIRLRYLEVTQ